MKNSSWKKIVGVTLGIFALFFGSVGLTGCESGGEEEGLEQEGEELGEELEEGGEELEEEGEELEEELDDDDDDD
ncbi:hypothetical protein [Pleurocapsa sp. PCC 7319]|uniref:hypothetical protein n=1 Tax=Pleurocapsa sp. PCC 7319 TaxID=118161 RepID=UPI0003469ED5|nr:hypothetical protein [Pleurocapsa sp. PCC 7319]